MRLMLISPLSHLFWFQIAEILLFSLVLCWLYTLFYRFMIFSYSVQFILVNLCVLISFILLKLFSIFWKSIVLCHKHWWCFRWNKILKCIFKWRCCSKSGRRSYISMISLWSEWFFKFFCLFLQFRKKCFCRCLKCFTRLTIYLD